MTDWQVALIDITLSWVFAVYVVAGMCMKQLHMRGLALHAAWAISKWPAAVEVVWDPLSPIVVDAEAPGTMRILGMFVSAYFWWHYRDAGDDDDFYRRRKRMQQQIKQFGGRLVVVPAPVH